MAITVMRDSRHGFCETKYFTVSGCLLLLEGRGELKAKGPNLTPLRRYDERRILDVQH